MTLLATGTRLITEYDRLTGQLVAEETARMWSWQKMGYVERPVYVVSLGRQDGARAADPDAQLAREHLPSELSAARLDALRKASASVRQRTELAILACLREHGPQTRADIARRTGLVPDTVTDALLRRPDLFGHNKRRYNRIWRLLPRTGD